VRKIFIKVLNVISAFTSFGSGIFWLLSAQAQLEAMNLANLVSSEKVQKGIAALSKISAEYNFWAAIFAGITGIALAIIVTAADD
jgi:hypothetical protein